MINGSVSHYCLSLLKSLFHKMCEFNSAYTETKEFFFPGSATPFNVSCIHYLCIHYFVKSSECQRCYLVLRFNRLDVKYNFHSVVLGAAGARGRRY